MTGKAMFHVAMATALFAISARGAQAQDIVRPAQSQDAFSEETAALAAPSAPVTDCLEPPADSEAEPQSVILPTTGAVFTLPPIASDNEEGQTDSTTPDSTACADLPPPPPPRPDPPDIFGLAALPVGTAATLARWDMVRTASLDGVAGPWTELVDQIPDLPDLNPLDLVNRWVNWHVRYLDDSDGDHWSPPASTMLQGFGDCEDFSIAKMALLRMVGIPDDDMFLVLLRDRHRRIDHAVLAVRRDGRTWVLDNRTDKLLPQEQVADYAPTMSFSGPFMWIYGQRSAHNVPASDKR
ncbi:MAG: transglutaminase-like cysteine peptidase [Novosphingobium sp.]|nr:transglutaminase-like cysteine peptidase [Novosphingobium sp.]